MEIYSDASLTGWGAVCKTQRCYGFGLRLNHNIINHLELKAACFGLVCFAKGLQTQNLHTTTL